MVSSEGGDHIILAPSYIITDKDIEEIVTRVTAAVKEVFSELEGWKWSEYYASIKADLKPAGYSRYFFWVLKKEYLIGIRLNPYLFVLNSYLLNYQVKEAKRNLHYFWIITFKKIKGTYIIFTLVERETIDTT